MIRGGFLWAKMMIEYTLWHPDQILEYTIQSFNFGKMYQINAPKKLDPTTLQRSWHKTKRWFFKPTVSASAWMCPFFFRSLPTLKFNFCNFAKCFLQQCLFINYLYNVSFSLFMSHVHSEKKLPLVRTIIHSPKFKSSPLRNDAWKTSLSFLGRSIFRGYCW